jgi:hypothetical protein
MLYLCIAMNVSMPTASRILTPMPMPMPMCMCIPSRGPRSFGISV